MPKLLYWPYLGVNFVFKDPNFEDPHIKNFDTLTVWWFMSKLVDGFHLNYFLVDAEWFRDRLWRICDSGKNWGMLDYSFQVLLWRRLSDSSLWKKLLLQTHVDSSLIGPKSWYQLLIYFFISRLVIHSLGYPYFFYVHKIFRFVMLPSKPKVSFLDWFLLMSFYSSDLIVYYGKISVMERVDAV